MVTPKWVTTPCQPIAVRNVLNYLTGVLEKPETAARVFDIGGPEVLSYREIMNIMAEELHLPRRIIIPLPVLTPLLSSYWIHLVTPLSKDIARPLAEGLKNPVVAREDSITKIIPQELLTVRQAIKAARSKTADGTGRNQLVDGRPDRRRSHTGPAAPSSRMSAKCKSTRHRTPSFKPSRFSAAITAGIPPNISGRFAVGWIVSSAAPASVADAFTPIVSATAKRSTSGASSASSATNRSCCAPK